MAFSILMISGCGNSSSDEENCETDAECTSLPCGACIEGNCLPRKKPDCCGNNECESGENECTCSDDCGECISEDNIISKKCNEDDECISFVDESSLNTASTDNKVKIGDSVISFTPYYDDPFILGKSKLNIRIKADKLEDKTEFLIKRIKVYEKGSGSNKVLLAEKDLNQGLYTMKTEIDESFILDIEADHDELVRLKKNIVVEVFYDKEYYDSNGNQRKTTSSFERTVDNDMNIVVLSEPIVCKDSECRDDNECTRDFCKPVGDYSYCVNEYITSRDCCGNKVCESSEDKCGCPYDCGECGHDYGTYLSFECTDNNKCMPAIRDNVLEQKSKIFTSRTIPDFRFEAKVFYEQPFKLDKKFTVEITMLSIDDDVDEGKITTIQLIESSDNLLGELEANDNLPSVGDNSDYDFSPELLSMADYERVLTPKIVINFKYKTIIGSGDNQRIVDHIAKETFRLDKIYFANI